MCQLRPGHVDEDERWVVVNQGPRCEPVGVEGDFVEVDAATAPARLGGEDRRPSEPPRTAAAWLPGAIVERSAGSPARNQAVRSPGGGSARPGEAGPEARRGHRGEALAGARGAGRCSSARHTAGVASWSAPANARRVFGLVVSAMARAVGVGRSSSGPGGLGESAHRHGTRWPLDVRATGDCDAGGSPVGQRCSKKLRVGSTPVIVRVDAGVVEFLVDPEPRGLVDPSAGPVCRITGKNTTFRQSLAT